MNSIVIVSIITVGIILAIIGIIVILTKLSTPKKKKVTKRKNPMEEKDFDLDDLMNVVKDGNLPSNDLMNALIYFKENFKIDQSNSKKCFMLISRILTHKNVTKNTFDYYHNEVKPKNEKFKKELDTIEKKALR